MLNQSRDEAKMLERELEEHRERDTTMREALLTAQKAMDEVRQHAQKDAQLIVSAELKAEQIIHSVRTYSGSKISQEISKTSNYSGRG